MARGRTFAGKRPASRVRFQGRGGVPAATAQSKSPAASQDMGSAPGGGGGVHPSDAGWRFFDVDVTRIVTHRSASPATSAIL